MPSRMRTTTCTGLVLLVVSLVACRTAAFAPPGADGTATTATATATATANTNTDSAFVPPVSSTTTRGWFGGVIPTNTKPSDSAASISTRPASAFAPTSGTGTAAVRSKVSGRTWVPAAAARGAGAGSSCATSATGRDGMTMDAAAGSTPPPRIIIAGAPASGKGTQCSMIKERYGVVHLSTGDGGLEGGGYCHIRSTP